MEPKAPTSHATYSPAPGAIIALRGDSRGKISGVNNNLEPTHPFYRCEDGHITPSLRKLDPPPETLPCPHVLEGSQDACRKEAKRFHGRSAQGT